VISSPGRTLGLPARLTAAVTAFELWLCIGEGIADALSNAVVLGA
jgi:hypothetical protein